MLKNLFSSFFINKEPAQQDILGIDISHSYVRIIQLVKKKKQWSLLKVASKSLDETYESYEKKQEAIVSLLKNLVSVSIFYLLYIIYYYINYFLN